MTSVFLTHKHLVQFSMLTDNNEWSLTTVITITLMFITWSVTILVSDKPWDRLWVNADSFSTGYLYILTYTYLHPRVWTGLKYINIIQALHVNLQTLVIDCFKQVKAVFTFAFFFLVTMGQQYSTGDIMTNLGLYRLHSRSPETWLLSHTFLYVFTESAGDATQKNYYY